MKTFFLGLKHVFRIFSGFPGLQFDLGRLLAVIINHADILVKDFDDQIVIGIFFFYSFLQVVKILIMTQPFNDFIGQIIALFFNQIGQRDDAAATHFQHHIAIRLVFGNGKGHSLDFIGPAIGMKGNFEINRITRADHYRSRRRVDDTGLFAGLGVIGIDRNVQNGIIDEFIML